MANQQLALEIVAKDLATATLQKVDAALLDVARRQGSVTAATNSAITSTGQWSAGLNKASNALENLAGNLLGVNNQVANMAEGLLQAVGGGGAVTLVAAGIAAAAGAMLYFTKSAREAQAAYDGFLASLTKASPLAVVGRQIDELTEKLNKPIMSLTLFEAFDRIFNGKGDLSQLEQAKRIYADILAGFEQSRQRAREANAVVLPDLIAGPRAPGPAKRGDITGKLGLEPKGPAEAIGLRVGGDFTAMIPDVQQAGTVFTDFADTLDLIVFRMGAISDATAGIADGFAALGDVVGGGIGNVAKKVLAPFMKLEGTYFVIKGLAKLAEGLFPPNAALIASGSGMVARGRQLLSMAGGGSVGGGGGGSGGGSAAGGASRDVRDAQQRGTVTVVWPKDAFANPRDPKFQEYLAETIRAAAGRNVVFA